MKSRCFLLFLFSIISQFSAAQNHALDSLYDVLKNNPVHDTLRVLTLLRVCYLENTMRPVKSKELAEEALVISDEINFTKGKASANRYIASYYQTVGDHGQAIKYAYEMLKIYESISYPKGVGQANQLLGIIHEAERNFEKAEFFYNHALDVYKQAKLEKEVASCYNSLGSLRVSLSKSDEAEAYFEKSMDIRLRIHDEDGLSQSYGNLALVYTNQKKYVLAQGYFEKAQIILNKINNRYRIAINYTNMGKMFMLIGNYDKAEYYLLESTKLAKKIRNKYVLREAYAKLTALEKTRGRFESALKYFELESSYQDSIYTDEKSKQIAEIETRYETENKTQIIQLLERDKQIQKLWADIFIIAFISALILSVVIYFLQRYREQKNRKILNLEIDFLTSQNKELSEKQKDMLIGGNATSIESIDQRLLKKVIEVVENNISDPYFSVEQMAKELGMSRTNMHRKIKAVTGFPPRELIRNIRMRKAAVLLLNKADTVSQISFSVGFDDHSYFSKTFKKHFGVAPSDYLQSREQSN